MTKQLPTPFVFVVRARSQTGDVEATFSTWSAAQRFADRHFAGYTDRSIHPAVVDPSTPEGLRQDWPYYCVILPNSGNHALKVDEVEPGQWKSPPWFRSIVGNFYMTVQARDEQHAIERAQYFRKAFLDHLAAEGVSRDVHG